MAPAKSAPDETLDACFARYWTDHVRHMPSAVTTQYHITRLLERLDQTTPISGLTTAMLAAYVATRRAEVAPATVNRELSCLRAMHSKAGQEWEYDVRVIAWRRLMLTEPKERVRWITRAEADQLMDALPLHIAWAAEWSLLTGCRRSETYGLEWKRVDMEARTVSVWGKAQCWQQVELSDSALVLLANQPGGRVGKVFSETNRRRFWAGACEVAGLEDFRWHDLRHTYATWLRQEGAPIETVQKLLRHRDISTTMRYAHVDRSEMQEAVQRLTSKVTSLINRT